MHPNCSQLIVGIKWIFPLVYYARIFNTESNLSDSERENRGLVFHLSFYFVVGGTVYDGGE